MATDSNSRSLHSLLSQTLTREVIDSLSGVAFFGAQQYSESTKRFFEDRYIALLSLVPRIQPIDIGLEVGLSGGILAFLLQRVFSLHTLYALEHPTTCRQYTKLFLRKLDHHGINLRPVDLHAGKFPWRDEFFDFIVFSEVMEHLIPADVPAVVSEMYRVLKQGGWLLVTTPNVASLLKRINLVRGKNPIEFDLNLHEDATYGHIREYTMDEVTSIIECQRFTVVRRTHFMIDVKRNVFTRLEDLSAKAIPSLANNIAIVAEKR